jgi:hypothetical protein
LEAVAATLWLPAITRNTEYTRSELQLTQMTRLKYNVGAKASPAANVHSSRRRPSMIPVAATSRTSSSFSTTTLVHPASHENKHISLFVQM